MYYEISFNNNNNKKNFEKDGIFSQNTYDYIHSPFKINYRRNYGFETLEDIQN